MKDSLVVQRSNGPNVAADWRKDTLAPLCHHPRVWRKKTNGWSGEAKIR